MSADGNGVSSLPLDLSWVPGFESLAVASHPLQLIESFATGSSFCLNGFQLANVFCGKIPVSGTVDD